MDKYSREVYGLQGTVRMQLQKQNAIFMGSEKQVYQHPDSRALLVKIVRDQSVNAKRNQHFGGARFMRLPKYWSFASEIMEFFAMREGGKETLKYVEQVVGLVDTNAGVGMVVSKVCQENGNIAKSLKAMIDEGEFDESYQVCLDSLFR